MYKKLAIEQDEERYCGVCGSYDNVMKIVVATDFNTGQINEKSVPICLNCLRDLNRKLSNMFEEDQNGIHIEK